MVSRAARMIRVRVHRITSDEFGSTSNGLFDHAVHQINLYKVICAMRGHQMRWNMNVKTCMGMVIDP